MRCPVCLDEGAQRHVMVAGRQQYRCTRKACGRLFFADAGSEFNGSIPHAPPQSDQRPGTVSPNPSSKMGRPLKYTAEDREKVTTMQSDGESSVDIARELEIPRSSVSRLMERQPITETLEVAAAIIAQRPNLAGIPHGRKLIVMHDWYEQNKTAILRTVEERGEEAARAEWQITKATLDGLLHRWTRSTTGTRQMEALGMIEPTKQEPAKAPEVPVLARLTTIEKELTDFKAKAQETTKSILDTLTGIDGGVGELLNRGSMPDELKLDVIQALVHSALWDERDKAKKILEVVKALEGV